MPSFWPWKGEANDAAAFEKTLSTIATKIARTSALNDSLRQRARRTKTIITLWGGFAYILIAVISVLVTGWRNWGPVEFSVVAGGPLLLYGLRRACTTYYDYRISNTQAYLDSLNKERDSTIEKLKSATKYNSTQALLEKYGSSPKAAKQSPSNEGKRKSQGPKEQRPPQGRTSLPPPATANIQRPHGGPGPAQELSQVASAPSTPVRPEQQQLLGPRGGAPFPPAGAPNSLPGEEFAPNAFASEPQYAPAPAGRPGWLDRLMDTLMGEDETLSKNRFALICQNCRLVNGQAPPGTISLEDVGRWRCAGCGTLNGEESEATKLVKQISRQAEELKEAETAVDYTGSEDDEAVVVEKNEDVDDEDEAKEELKDKTPAKSTRSKTKGKGKKGT